MPTNDFKPFATGAGANVIAQADYIALAALGAGFSVGIADPAQLNKVWRQASFVAAALAQLTSDALAIDILDDGNEAGFEGNLAAAMRKLGYAADAGAANAYIISPLPAPTAYAAGQSFTFKAANSCTGASTLNVSGLGAKAILRPGGGALQAGDIIAGQMVTASYDGASFQLVAALTGVTQATNDSSTKPATTAFANPGASLAVSGYNKLPSGLIVQWGSFVSSASADVSVVFPITFPTAAYQVAFGPQIVTAVNCPGYNSLTVTGFAGNSWNTSGSRVITTVSYMATGK